MANSQTIDKILNKQFKKTAFAGYETIDVDSFFDTVIDYLKSSDKNVEEYKNQLDKLINDNKTLQTRMEELHRQITQLKSVIATYEREGYGNVMMSKRMSNLEQQFNNLKKEKENGK